MSQNALARSAWFPPDNSEVVQRGSLFPLGVYRTPDGQEVTALAFPQPMRDALDALGYAGGIQQDPAAPDGYVSRNALIRGGQGLAESAMVGSLAARAPAGAVRSGAAADDMGLGQLLVELARQRGLFPDGKAPTPPDLPPQQYERRLRSGSRVSRTPDDMIVSRDNIGSVEGVATGDPQITYSGLEPRYQGQGIGSQMYREFAEELGVPFRSDNTVSREAAVMYEQMLPRYGYNVLRNPDATYNPNGGMSYTGGWYGPRGTERNHVYRVEPPGMNSTEFYSNARPGSGVGAAMSAARNQALDPSRAARLARAREMGFDSDEVLYHGTNREFSEFAANPGTYGEGVYMTPDPDYASAIAINWANSGSPDGTSVIPAYARGKIATKDDLARELQRQSTGDVSYAQAYELAMKELEKQGFSGARHGVNDVLIFDPRNIRSVNAMFDPAKSDSANLLAADPMAGAVTLAFPEPDDRRQNALLY